MIWYGMAYGMTCVSRLRVHVVVLRQSDGMVETAAPSVKRHRLRCPPDGLQMPRKVVCRRRRPRIVHDTDRLTRWNEGEGDDAAVAVSMTPVLRTGSAHVAPSIRNNLTTQQGSHLGGRLLLRKPGYRRSTDKNEPTSENMATLTFGDGARCIGS